MSTHKKAETETAASPTDTVEALKLLEQVVAALALPAQVLTTKQRKAAARSRKGMERIVPALATLSVQHGVSVPKQPTSQMTSNLDLVNQLETVNTQLKSLTATVGENLVAARRAVGVAARSGEGLLRLPHGGGEEGASEAPEPGREEGRAGGREGDRGAGAGGELGSGRGGFACGAERGLGDGIDERGGDRGVERGGCAHGLTVGAVAVGPLGVGRRRGAFL
jgi:hypothetical protein